MLNKEYYASEEWKRKREERLRYDNYRCQNCGSTKHLQVHHKHYVPYGTEDVKCDLITECIDCHDKITNISRNKHQYRPNYGKEGNTFWW